MDCNPPGSSIHGIFQARIQCGLPCSPPGDLPYPGMEPMSLLSPALAGRFFTTSATGGSVSKWGGQGASQQGVVEPLSVRREEPRVEAVPALTLADLLPSRKVGLVWPHLRLSRDWKSLYLCEITWFLTVSSAFKGKKNIIAQCRPEETELQTRNWLGMIFCGFCIIPIDCHMRKLRPREVKWCTQQTEVEWHGLSWWPIS